MAVAATGFFDGVHLGHRAVIETLLETARERSEQSLILTFWPHPRTVLRGGSRDLRLLTSLDEKIALLKGLGVDRVEVLPFTRDFAALTAREYLELLQKDYGVTSIVLGYDNRFGSDGLSTEQIVALSDIVGLKAEVVSACAVGNKASSDARPARVFDEDKYGKGERPLGDSGVSPVEERPRVAQICWGESASPNYISSTKIRKTLSAGDVKSAAQMLGYEYSLSGVVVSGNMMGRTIGFPTANMKLREPLKCLPGVGAYLTRVEVEGRQLWGMTNIDHNEKIETNIFDFDEEIYGLDLKVTFVDKLRDEIHFNSFEELKTQLLRDRAAASALIPA
ncbi:MAG: bifunctional riboflavin kinase/FMN adenylyltransferase [Bacteroidales bacterium]|nr:bifunctional riboflavin kinase/FMN adenylyltransferase [Bacteroidales bacterium]